MDYYYVESILYSLVPNILHYSVSESVNGCQMETFRFGNYGTPTMLGLLMNVIKQPAVLEGSLYQSQKIYEGDYYKNISSERALEQQGILHDDVGRLSTGLRIIEARLTFWWAYKST